MEKAQAQTEWGLEKYRICFADAEPYLSARHFPCWKNDDGTVSSNSLNKFAKIIESRLLF